MTGYKPSILYIRYFAVLDRGYANFREIRRFCKAMFYSGPISGLWPDMEELVRIRAYVEAAGGLRAAA
jgi:hypothetical protein